MVCDGFIFNREDHTKKDLSLIHISNLFLCKVAMDIVAKHIPADKNGVRIAELDEYRGKKGICIPSYGSAEKACA